MYLGSVELTKKTSREGSAVGLRLSSYFSFSYQTCTFFTNLTSCEPLSAPLWRHQAPDKPVIRVPHAVHLVLCSAKESSWASHTSSLFLNNSTSPGSGHSPHKMMEFPAPPASSPCPPTQEGSALWHRSSRGHSCFSDASFLRIHSAPWHLTPLQWQSCRGERITAKQGRMPGLVQAYPKRAISSALALQGPTLDSVDFCTQN